MKFFVDTAEVAEIRSLAEAGLVDGVTTNPSLIAKAGRPMAEVIREICSITPGPVSAEVTAIEYEQMLAEGRHLREIAPNVAVKVPLTEAGLRTCRALSAEGTLVNVTLCFSPAQALLAAKAGATFISPFVGRLDDIATDGMRLIEDIVKKIEDDPSEAGVDAAQKSFDAKKDGLKSKWEAIKNARGIQVSEDVTKKLNDSVKADMDKLQGVQSKLTSDVDAMNKFVKLVQAYGDVIKM